MNSTESPANRLLIPLVAFAGTLAGVLVLVFAQSELAPYLIGGPGSICHAPDCVLGVGLWLIVGAFAVLCASVVASVIVAFRRSQPSIRDTMRTGLFVSLWCVLAYLAMSIVVWVLA